jgi:hypothetical protein
MRGRFRRSASKSLISEARVLHKALVPRAVASETTSIISRFSSQNSMS